MRTVIYSFLFLLTVNVFAKDIVLLTSLPQSEERFEKKMDLYFWKKIRDFKKKGFNIIVKHRADSQILNAVLTSPNTHAAFWMSHGGASKKQKEIGLKASPKLIDSNGDDVAKVFQKIHPNIKFVGVIGCNSALIMQGLLPQRPDLNYYIPKGKISAKRAVRVSIRKFRSFDKRNSNKLITSPKISLGHKVEVRRITGDQFETYKPLQVFLGDHFLGVLPKMEANADKIFSVYIPDQETYSKSDLKFVFTTGQSAFDASDYFGEINLEHENQRFWKLFAKPDGTAFGVNVRIFHFKSDPLVLMMPVQYTLFQQEKKNE